NQHDGRLVAKMPEPVDKFLLIGMRRQSSDRMYLCAHLDRLTPDLDAARSVDDGATGGTLRLEADDHQVSVRFPRMMLEMVTDPPTRAHSGTGDNDRATVAVIQRARLLRGLAEMQVRQAEARLSHAGPVFLLIQCPVSGVDLRGLD